MREKDVWSAIETINRIWTQGEGKGLEEWFHPDMIAITPAQAEPLRGGAACAACWQRFARVVKVDAWHTWNPTVHIYGDSAVAAYRYELRGKVDGAPMVLRGRDLMTLVFSRGRWLLAADHFSPEPPSTS